MIAEEGKAEAAIGRTVKSQISDRPCSDGILSQADTLQSTKGSLSCLDITVLIQYPLEKTIKNSSELWGPNLLPLFCHCSLGRP